MCSSFISIIPLSFFKSKSGMSEVSVLNWSLTRYPTSVSEKNIGPLQPCATARATIYPNDLKCPFKVLTKSWRKKQFISPPCINRPTVDWKNSEKNSLVDCPKSFSSSSMKSIFKLRRALVKQRLIFFNVSPNICLLCIDKVFLFSWSWNKVSATSRYIVELYWNS